MTRSRIDEWSGGVAGTSASDEPANNLTNTYGDERDGGVVAIDPTKRDADRPAAVRSRDRRRRHGETWFDAELSAAITLFDTPDDVLDVEAQRESFRRNYELARPLSLVGVEVQDIEAESSGQPPVRVRTYRPIHATGKPLPVLLWLHGGAFSFGFAEIDDDFCSRLALDAGYLIASPDYRLSPEHPFPASIDDAYNTLEWMVARAASLGIDTGCIAVGGSSSGGALAAAVCLRARDEHGPSIQLQILSCPVTDDRMDTHSMRMYDDTPVFDRVQTASMWDRYLGVDRPAVISPYAAPGRARSLADLPPAYIVTAQHDPLRDEALSYGMRLIAAGNRTELHHLPDTFHSFDLVVPTSGVSLRAYADYLAVLRRTRAEAAPSTPAKREEDERRPDLPQYGSTTTLSRVP
jgi:acetyl esterase